MKNTMITIIIPYSNNNINKTIESIKKSSYRDLNIVIYSSENNENYENIVYKKDTGNIYKNITNSINEIVDGYVSILYPGNEVTIDFYRCLYNKINETSSDLVLSNYIFNKGKSKIIYNLINIPYNEINDYECLDKYMSQEGLNNIWNLLQNRLYSVDLLKKLVKYDINSEFAFNYYLFSFCKKINKIDNDFVIIDSNKSITIDEYNSIFEDSSFVDNKYKDSLQKWNDLYCESLKTNSSFDINKYNKEYKTVDNKNYYYAVETPWCDKYEKIKQKIMSEKISTVSFDIFDTLIVRPFLNPADIFDIVDKYFRDLTKNKTATEFKNIRVDSEKEARILKKKKEGTLEVNLDDIYNVLKSRYSIDDKIAEKLKQYELDQELRFCRRRNTGYELYSLAKYLNKKVICISDMYLSSDFVKKILSKNEINVDAVYISCEGGKSKAEGDLYSFVANKEHIEPSKTLHIGDNVQSDIVNSSKSGYNNAHLPKASDIMFDPNSVSCLSAMYTQQLPFWIDNKNALNFNAVRVILAMVANRYLDNPYTSFREKSDFNADPYLIGYFALGSYMFGITKWILDDLQNEDYDSLVFMARDGYLPMMCYDAMKKYYNKKPEAKYLYISRKSLIPVIIQDVVDFYKLPETLNITSNTPNDIIHYIKDLIDYDKDRFEEDCKKIKLDANKKLDDMEEFNSLIELIINKYYNKSKHDKNKKVYKEYFKDMFNGNSATFDIGYSARPSYFISNLLEEPIDTYFCNISHNQALRHAEMGKFKLKTFFDGKPVTTGHAYEMLVSSLTASCIAYDIIDGKVVERFGNNKFSSMEKYAIETMQGAAMDFINDLCDTFKDDINILYTQNYYTGLPFLAYMSSSKEIDKYPFGCVDFEDDLVFNKKIKMNQVWQEELDLRNQYNMPSLLSLKANNDGNFVSGNRLVYNSHVDLNGRSKIVRIIYYLLFDRDTFKRRINDILKSKKKK